MRPLGNTALILFLSMTFPNFAQAAAKPETVPRLSVRALETPAYVELAKQWKEYIEQEGETVEALVNLSFAYVYSSEKAAARKTAGKAYQLDSDNPQAIECLAHMLCSLRSSDDDMERGQKLLERCLEIDPGFDHALYGLAGAYLRRGDLNKSQELHKSIFDRNIIPRPLQDYAYNMLVGLPEGAVLITNGDNDTFPPLALQAGMDFRTDVIILNRSLLNTGSYAEAMFQRFPNIRPRGGIKPEDDLSNTLLKMLVSEAKAPIYFAVTVYFDGLDFSPPRNREGINYRSAGKGLTADEVTRMFLDKYRLDSATDWTYAWDLTPSVKMMMRNYIWAMMKQAEEEKMDACTRERLLDKALAIAEFHNQWDAVAQIETMRKK